jgi:multiple sugar transport system substrate-binding protein
LNKSNKRKILIAILIVMLSLSMLLTACGGNANNTTSENSNTGQNVSNSEKNKSDEESQEEVTLRLFTAHGQFKEGQYGYNQIQEFMKVHPNIKVEVTYAAWGKPWDDTFLALASSNDLPDLIQPTSTFPLPYLLENNWVQPIDEYVREDFKSIFPEGTFVEGVTAHNGETYSFPRVIVRQGVAMLYNKDVLKQAGLDPNKPPKTWDELLDMSKTVTEKLDGVFGLALDLKEKSGYQHILRFAQGYQPTLDTTGFDYQKGAYDFDSEHVSKAVEFFLKLRDEGVLHPNSPTWTLHDISGVIANKQVAFAFKGHSEVRVLNNEFSDVSGFDMAPLPVPEAGMELRQVVPATAPSTFVTTSSKHPKEAGMLIDWITSQEYFVNQMKVDLLLAPIPSLYESEENFTKPELKNLADALNSTTVFRPMPESKPEGSQVLTIEKTLPGPKPDWFEVLQGAYFDKIPDWKSALTEVNDAYNKRFEDSIKQAQDEGFDISKDDFTFPDFDGSKDYIME